MNRQNRLVIGTRRYSSWSLRGWLAVRLAGLDVQDVVIPLRGGGQTTEIHDVSPNGLVPYLEHDGACVWESLAICEYCAEHEPTLWPSDRLARAHARSVSAEMHAGFSALRRALPMNLGRFAPRAALDDAAMQDIASIDRLWRAALAQYGGKFLFGDKLTVADVMYVPVVLRFESYQIATSRPVQDYMRAIVAHPLVQLWRDLAAQEPAAWHLERYEALD
ncbi:glutathione S-transferase [Neoasaia chiangmaiensis]|uniref:Glutathione S-transferase n=1 Tax=Neoasaia chiangmaiensis TaxID=320497 RepID=A0A1U9KTC3_9PROT|nr:glutathione S-transferase [Neoasaia chiangmaiensis]